MTRNGKIARLPAAIRLELNQRLADGEPGDSLLAWLNGLPAVRQSLRQHFDGAPIAKQNLSQWRTGGFRQWQVREEFLEHACQAWDAAGHLDEFVDTSLLAGRLAALLTSRYAALLNDWDGEPDPKMEEQLRVLRHLNRDLALLQRTIHQAHRQQREQEEAAQQLEQRENELEKKRAVAPIMAQMESEAMAAQLGGGDRARRIADVLAANKYDLPPPKPKKEEPAAKPKEQPGQTAPQPPPSQAQSGSVRPVRPNPSPMKHGHGATTPETARKESEPVMTCPLPHQPNCKLKF